MSKKFPIYLGQTVYLRGTGNAAQKHCDELIEGTIDKIGRRYFYVKASGLSWGNGVAKFDLDTFTCYDTDNNYGYKIYETQQDYLDEKEAMEKQKAIYKALGPFSGEMLRLETLRIIYALLVADGIIACKQKQATSEKASDKNKR